MAEGMERPPPLTGAEVPHPNDSRRTDFTTLPVIWNGLAERRLREHVLLARSWRDKNAGPRPKRYNGAWDDLCRVAAGIVEAREVPSSLRYVFYRLVTLDLLVNDLSDYNQLTSASAKARREGWFPRLVDHNREIHRPAAYGSLGEQLHAESERMIDRDAGQPYAIFVAVEKATVAESVKSWMEPYGIPVIVLRGYASQTLIDQVGEDVSEEMDVEVAEVAGDVLGMLGTESRPSVLLTIGDFDASGDHLMRLFVERTNCWEKVISVGVTFEQARDLPQAPAKKTDTRIAKFVERYWPEEYNRLLHDMRDRTQAQKVAKLAEVACQVEVEALEAAATADNPEPLRAHLLDALADYWDREVAQAQLVRERRNQRILRALAAAPEDDLAGWLGVA